jgi:prephenate dehydratase
LPGCPGIKANALVLGDDEAARDALRHLGEIAEFVKVLGTYPAAKARSS